MNYKSFCEVLKQELSEILDGKAAVAMQEIQKNNGVILDSFCLRKPGEPCSPAVHLAPLYESYLNGDSVQEICENILSCLENQPPLPDTVLSCLRDFSAARESVSFRLVSLRCNEELLSDVPWFPFLDLAVVFFLCLDKKNAGHLTALIHNAQLEQWKISAEDLYELAGVNTPRLFPPVLEKLEDALAEMAESEESPAYVPREPFSSTKPPLWLLTNKSGVNGAACMLYDGIIKDLADTLQEDLLILPSSVHEVLLSPDTHEISYQKLQNMICQINQEEVPPEDRLSDRLYRYCRKSQSFMPCLPLDDFPDTPVPAGKSNP